MSSTSAPPLPSGKLWVKCQGGWEDAKSLNPIYAEPISRYHAIKIIEAFLKKRLQKASKSKYTHLTSAPDSKCSVREDVLWIQVSTVGSRENHGYSSLGELIRRLDLSGSVWQTRRFSYVICLTELIVQKKLIEFGGTAQKHFFQLVECLVQRVYETHERIRQMRHILSGLISLLYKKRAKLIGSKTTWFSQVEFIRKCQTKLNLIEIKPRYDTRATITNMPITIQHKILTYLDEYEDLETVEKVNKNFQDLCKQDKMWEKLCLAQFTQEQRNEGIKIINHRRKMQILRTGKSTFNDPLTWREIYCVLSKSFKKVEVFSDPLLLCKKCRILFWLESGHPCISPSRPELYEKITPSRLISFF